jgi:hypothetical protein
MPKQPRDVDLISATLFPQDSFGQGRAADLLVKATGHGRLARLHSRGRLGGRDRYANRPCGAIAQLGERLNGIQEVGGSTPPGSTRIKF